MVALKLQQFQYNLKKNFLRRLFPMPFGPTDPPPPGGGRLQGGGGDCKGGGRQESGVRTPARHPRVHVRNTTWVRAE